MKHLPKHLQPRWRYLAVEMEAWPDAELDRGTLQRHVWYAAQNLLGDAGSADLDLTVLSAHVKSGRGEMVVRTYRGEVERARAVLATLSRVDGHEIGLRIRGVSGTVRACEEKYMGRRREKPDQRDVVFRDDRRPASVRGDRADVRTDRAFTGATTLDI